MVRLSIKRNFDHDNLVAIPRKYIGQLNNPFLPSYHDKESLMACIALCDLRSATIDAENSRPRMCEVCWCEFVPDERQRAFPGTVKTCRSCLDAGRKASGKRRS